MFTVPAAAAVVVVMVLLAATTTSASAVVSAPEQLVDPKDVKKTIQSEGGVIDCVDINRQPSLKHPLFRDHKVQLKPARSWRPKAEEEVTSSRSSGAETRQRAEQTWRRSGSCPQGKVPIRRTPGENVNMAVADHTLRRSFSTPPAPASRSGADC